MKNNKLLVLDEILYKNLAPWLAKNNPDEKFHDLIEEVKVIKPEFQYLYEFSFIRPFNQKTIYYKKLIINETTSYCNKVIDLINSCQDSKEKKYLINDTLNKKLKTRLKDIGKVINEKDYKVDFINSRNTPFNMDIDHKANTYIVQLLKTALIKIYMEIQEVFKSFISEDNIFILEDFYTQFLFEPTPENHLLTKTPVTIKIQETKEEETESPEPTKIFTPNQSDFRGIGKSPVKYSDIRNIELFTKFEQELFNSGLIDGNYIFQEKRGNKNMLAAIYHILIQKQYFRKRSKGRHTDFEPHHYRQFLDFRYNVKTNQQFRKCKSEEIASFKYKFLWIDSIEFCRQTTTVEH